MAKMTSDKFEEALRKKVCPSCGTDYHSLHVVGAEFELHSYTPYYYTKIVCNSCFVEFRVWKDLFGCNGFEVEQE